MGNDAAADRPAGVVAPHNPATARIEGNEVALDVGREHAAADGEIATEQILDRAGARFVPRNTCMSPPASAG